MCSKIYFQFLKVLSLLLAFFLLVSCVNEHKTNLEDSSLYQKNNPRMASCYDYVPFRRFYTLQKKEGFSGWEIAYLLSLGYTSDQLADMDFHQKRALLLPGITGIADDRGHYDKLSEDDQRKLAEHGISPSVFEGLSAIGFQNISWLSQEKVDFLLPLDTLRERLEPDPFQEDLLFEGYPKLLETRLNIEKNNALLNNAEKRGLSYVQIQYLRNGGITYEEMLTLSEKEINNLLWGLPQNAGRSEQLYTLGYTPEEMNLLSEDEESYIFPFEDLLSKLENDGFSWTTINAINRDSNGSIAFKTVIQIVLMSKQMEP